MADIVKWLLVGFLTMGTVSTIALVGKPRKPITPGTAALVTVVNGIIITLVAVFL